MLAATALLRTLNAIRKEGACNISAETLVAVHAQRGYAEPLERMIGRLSELLSELRTAEPRTTAHLATKRYFDDAAAHRVKFNVTKNRFIVCAENPEDPNYKRAHLYLPIGQKAYGIRIVRDVGDDFLFCAWECHAKRSTAAKLANQLRRDIQAGKEGYLPSAAVEHIVRGLVASVPDGINGVNNGANGLAPALQGRLLELQAGVNNIVHAMRAHPFGRERRPRGKKK